MVLIPKIIWQSGLRPEPAEIAPAHSKPCSLRRLISIAYTLKKLHLCHRIFSVRFYPKEKLKMAPLMPLPLEKYSYMRSYKHTFFKISSKLIALIESCVHQFICVFYLWKGEMSQVSAAKCMCVYLCFHI